MKEIIFFRAIITVIYYNNYVKLKKKNFEKLKESIYL